MKVGFEVYTFSTYIYIMKCELQSYYQWGWLQKLNAKRKQFFF